MIAFLLSMCRLLDPILMGLATIGLIEMRFVELGLGEMGVKQIEPLNANGLWAFISIRLPTVLSQPLIRVENSWQWQEICGCGSWVKSAEAKQFVQIELE
jgi:hypothetical protein